MLALYNKFSLDGIDIDWEYPGVGGAEGNGISSSDSANYLLFLQTLRKTLPTGAKITAAVQVWPFAGPDGNPMRDVSAFAKVFDWITIMNYDVWGSSSVPGPNAPLSDGCKNSLQPLANAYAAVNSWTSAGFPANQLALGTAAYGYISKSTATSLVARRHLSAGHGAGAGGSEHAARSRRASNVVLHNDDGGVSDGQIMFSDIVKQGALVLDPATRKWVGAGGFTRSWDSCSSTVRLTSLPRPFSHLIQTYADPLFPPLLNAALPPLRLVRPGHHLRRPGLALAQGPVRPPVGPPRSQRLGHARRHLKLGPHGRPSRWTRSLVQSPTTPLPPSFPLSWFSFGLDSFGLSFLVLPGSLVGPHVSSFAESLACESLDFCSSASTLSLTYIVPPLHIYLSIHGAFATLALDSASIER